MNIVLFSHPSFMDSSSMPRFVTMLKTGMEELGHKVDIWSPQPRIYNFPVAKSLKKWLGYFDQYVIFPIEIKVRLRKTPKETLFVFSDNAQGPWVPHVKKLPHVVHCHDFIALSSASGEQPLSRTKLSGRLYQNFIRRGLANATSFISISENTRKDLRRFLPAIPKMSEVVYNGLNYPFEPMTLPRRMSVLNGLGLSIPSHGFLIHVGGNQWYKNRAGVLEIYDAYVRSTNSRPLELWMVGAPPTEKLLSQAAGIPTRGQIRFLSHFSNQQVNAAYSHARVLIFPSYYEGFGWPIVEAMASGCLVMTTNHAPMTEVGEDAAIYIPRRKPESMNNWANTCSEKLIDILKLSSDEIDRRQKKGFLQAKKFATARAINAYDKLYRKVALDYVN